VEKKKNDGRAKTVEGGGQKKKNRVRGKGKPPGRETNKGEPKGHNGNGNKQSKGKIRGINYLSLRIPKNWTPLFERRGVTSTWGG